MRLLTLDVSLSCGFCHDRSDRPGDPPIIGEKKFNRGGEPITGFVDSCNAGAVAATWFITLLADLDRLGLGVDEVWIEAPATGMQGGTNALTGFVLGGLAFHLGSLALAKRKRIGFANVKTVRKHFIGSGNMPGPAAKKAVQENCDALGWKYPSNNGSDAAAIWHWRKFQLDPKSVPAIIGGKGRLLV